MSEMIDIQKIRRGQLDLFRESKSLNWTQVAEKVGRDKSYISQIMNGSRPFTEETAREFEQNAEMPLLFLDGVVIPGASNQEISAYVGETRQVSLEESRAVKAFLRNMRETK